tara:strand:- start:86 stop:283 length:198 start_codon:yes stop_codon:yes gene_type:complete
MKTTPSSKILGAIAVFVVVGGLIALVFFVPLVAAILFILLAAFAAGRKETRKSVITFMKDIIFGW